jgi:flagellin-like hook-associated protein FlgL
MRITESSTIADLLAGVTRSKSRISRLTMQMATQNRILRASDDPAGTGTLLRVDAELKRIGTFGKAIEQGNTLLKMTAGCLDGVSGMLGDIGSLLANLPSGNNPVLLSQLADQVDQLLGFGVDLANTRCDGKYIFGGMQTTTQPYVMAGATGKYTYQGDRGAIQYQVGEGISQVINISGAAAFGSTGAISLTGVLDRSAAVNTVVTSTMQVTDGNGATHDIVLTLQKTDAATWSVSASLPPGSTGVTLSGGTTTLRFDPVSGEPGQIDRGSPLVLTTTGATAGSAESSVNILLSAGSLIEADTGEGLSILGGCYQATSVFSALAQISANLRNGIAPTADDLAMISMMQNVVMQETSRAGLYAANLTTADDALSARSEYLLDLRSATQDVDLTEIGVKLKLEQAMLEAMLNAASNLIPKSLVDFLR